jgi:hypothetical protein
LADRISQGFLGNESVDEAAAQGLGRTFQSLHGDISLGFTTLKNDNTGLLYPEAFRKLARGDTKGFADGSYPSTRRTCHLNEWS